MLSREVMKTDVECVTPDDPAHLAAAKMRQMNVGFLPVCDQSGKVLGAITDRDIAIRLVADQRPATTKVNEIMTREVVFCRPEDDLEEAQKQMSEHQKSRLVCIDDDEHIVGVISLSDIAKSDSMAGARTMNQVTQREARGS
jgi:CBS domain-containing protein